MCTLGLFLLWQSSQQPPSVSSFTRGALEEQISNKHKSVHTHTDQKQASSQITVQTDKTHRLSFTDMLAKTIPCSVNVAHFCHVCCAVCVLFVSLTPLRWKTRPRKLSVCYITSCNLYFSADPGQPALCANIQPCLKPHTEDTQNLISSGK